MLNFILNEYPETTREIGKNSKSLAQEFSITEKFESQYDMNVKLYHIMQTIKCDQNIFRILCLPM